MCNRKHRGIALITAIWVLAVLLVLIAGFTAMVHTESEIARNFGELTRARWAARTGIQRAEAELLQLAGQPYTALDDSQRVLTPPVDDTTLGDATYQVEIQDEAGKVNLNTAPAETLGTLFSTEVADCIIDWRDADGTPQPNGAEDDYYTGLTPAYHCRNGALQTVEELLLVKGVTRDMLNAPVSEGGPKLEDLLTVSSHDANTDSAGQARLNITNATQDQWTSRCGDVLTADDITAIIKQRSSSPFTSPVSLLNVPNLSREKLAQIYDRLTATTDTDRKGLVNLNTAPAEVLTALPGMDAATAQAIIDHRGQAGPFTDVGQLLTLDGLSNATIEQVADLFTTRSTIFRLVATGTMPDSLAKTVSALVEVAQGTGGPMIRVLYWRE